jgi:hypothetical protein
MKTKSPIFLFFIIFLVFSCSFNKRTDIDVSYVKIKDVKIKRYGKDLFEINPDNIKNELKRLTKNYKYFLDADLDDTLNLIQIHDYITDTNLIEIYNESIKKYPELNNLEYDLTLAFKHYKYYFPDKKIPEVFTYISGLQYEYPVQYFDNILIIALDLYLGKDYIPYRQIRLPAYKIKRMEADYIVTDCMKKIAEVNFLQQEPERTFLDEIIKKGKVLYFLDAVIPQTPDTVKIGFTSNQLQWCRDNEANIWKFLINNNILYSADYQVIKKFTLDGPFTAAFSKKSPTRIGNWLGWQIVSSYMNKNKDVSLNELMLDTDAQKILTKSKYKPKK